ncbi:DUF5110 domain-containing protein [Edaphobacter modestus]|uniref:DUF5110 domain-containing protein n=1 Tax=Edaphobacter modestus TaxID=388466 RepID=UPI001F5F3B4A|nr:DUF5110 domain-containing protein [Edaphobacter modestus]
MQPLVQSTNDVPNGPLTLRVYPGGNCRGTLYQDDGTTFAYERGGFRRMEFSCAQDGDQLMLHVGRRRDLRGKSVFGPSSQIMKACVRRVGIGPPSS